MTADAGHAPGPGASTPGQEQARRTITRTTITPAPGTIVPEPVLPTKPSFRDRLNSRRVHGDLTAAQEPYPGASIMRLVMASMLSLLCLLTIAGAVQTPGLAEVALGTPVRKIIDLADGSTGTVKAAFIGGPGAGALAADELGLGYDYDALAEVGGHIGSGSVLVTDAGTCMVATARFLLDFSAREACGKAVPCRIGTRRLVEGLDRILAATPRPNDLVLLRELSMKIADTALCRLESLAPRPMLTTLDRFADEYHAHAERGVCLAGSCSTEAVLPLLAPLADAGGVRPA